MSSFCIAKATHIFAAKISMYLKIPSLQVNEFVINDALNNWALATRILLGGIRKCLLLKLINAPTAHIHN